MTANSRSSTRVSEIGLKQLAGLKSLEQLYLGRTTVSRSGIEELKKVLPGVHISGG
jgi:hypothetical protein